MVAAHGDGGVQGAQALWLVQCFMLDGTNKKDGFLALARRKPERYRVYREDLQRRQGRKDAFLCAR
ncbi:hypothetical protein D3C87_2114030 [compost metagenome]